MPVTTDPTLAQRHPGRLDHEVISTLRAAAARAPHVLPPAIGELVARELTATVEVGLRVSSARALPLRVAAEVLALGAPPPPKPRVRPRPG